MQIGRAGPLNAACGALVATLLLLMFSQPARAQTLSVGSGAGLHVGSYTNVHADLWVRLDGIRPAETTTTVNFEVRAPRPTLGLGISTNQSFGPLGNLVVEAWGALAPHPGGGAAGELSLAARGVIGPAAVRLGLLAFGADSGTFRPSQLASPERPAFAGPAGGLQLGLTYRADRELIFELDPELYLTGSGLALRVEGAARLLRAVGENELRFEAHAYATPAFASAAVAAGAAVTFPRGREPDVTVGASVGYSPNGLWPGAHVTLGQRVGSVRLEVDAALEPYRLDVPALRLAAGARLPVGGFLPQGAELRFDAAVASDLGRFGPSSTKAWTGLALAFPVSLR